MDLADNKCSVFCSLLIMFLILFSHSVYAVTLNSYDSLEVDTKISIPINFIKTESHSSFDYLKINYSWLPLDDYRQKAIFIKTDPPSEISSHSAFMNINTPKDFIYEVNFRTLSYANYVKVKKKVKFPLNDLDSDLIYFTRETELIDINENIRSLASKIAGNEDDLYVVVFKLAEWVNTNIEYNLSTVTSQASLPSSWVLKNRRGVCDEMSNLFVSMVRSLGIPARTVTGIAYTSSDLFEDPWGAHGWTEVYFPKYGWIPFDPTYNQLGYVDATHIKLDEDLDSEKFSTKYFWKSSGYEIKPGKQQIKSSIVKKGNVITDGIDISVDLFSDKVDFNSYNVVKAKVKNLNDYYSAASISLAGMEGVKNIDELTKNVLLKPKSSAEVSWIVKLDGKFKNNFYYEFPMLLYTQNDLNVSKMFTARENGEHITLEAAKSYSDMESKNKNPDILFSCDSKRHIVFVNESFDISCSIQSEKKQNYLVCVNQEDCFVVEPKDYNHIFISKNFSDAGFKTFSITAKKLPSIEHAFLSVNVIDPAKLKLVKIEHNNNLDYSDFAKINFSLEKVSRSIPVNVSVKIVHDFFSQLWMLSKVDSEQPFSFKVPVSNLKNGRNEFSIIIKYYDELGNLYEHEQKIFIDVNESNILNKALLWFNTALNSILDLFG